jgi:hypothetical protein
MGLSLKNMLRFSSSVHFAHITFYWQFLLLHYTQVLCQYRLYTSRSRRTGPAYNISARIAQKTPFLCCSVIVAVETCLSAEPTLFRHLPGETEKKHEKPQQGYQVFRPSFEAGTSQMQAGSVIERLMARIFNKSSTMPWTHTGECKQSSTILDLDTRRRWVVRFAPRQLYPGGNRSRYPFYKRMSPETRWSLPCLESNPGRSARSHHLWPQH